MKLREYQKEAVKYALEHEKSVLILPTGTGKTIIGFYFLKKLFSENKIKKALIIVPTRILVEQTYRFYKNLGLDATKIYGLIDKRARASLWKNSRLIIATPETVVNDIALVKDIDALIVDECHHLVGNSAYVKLLKTLDARYKLGLSAYVPKKTRPLVRKYIGEIKSWPFERLSRYLSKWLAEIYETPFDKMEYYVYKELENRRLKASGVDLLIYTMAMKYFAKDGALALKETLAKPNKTSRLLSDLKDKILGLRDLHKLGQLDSVLKIYDFEKAILFVERVSIAKRLFELYEQRFRCFLIVGKKHKLKTYGSLDEANLIISTSAGEEGVDLPTADLLINWSNTNSVLKFIQRHGRILRKSDKIKFVAYLVTPYTVDADDLLYTIDQAKKYISINIDKETLVYLWKKSGYRKILVFLTEPLPLDWLAKLCKKSQKETRFALTRLLKTGEIVYIYTDLGKTYVRVDCLEKLERRFNSHLKPSKDLRTVRIELGQRTITCKNYSEAIERLRKLLPLYGLRISVEFEKNGFIELKTRSYDFLIKDENVLRYVLRNALSNN